MLPVLPAAALVRFSRAVDAGGAGLGNCRLPVLLHLKGLLSGFCRRPRWTTPQQVVSTLLRYREAAGLDAFQINFHGNRDLGQLLGAMERFTAEVKPRL